MDRELRQAVRCAQTVRLAANAGLHDTAPAVADCFEGPPFFRDVEFVRDAGAGIVAMTVSRPRIRAERFERLARERP